MTASRSACDDATGMCRIREVGGVDAALGATAPSCTAGASSTRSGAPAAPARTRARGAAASAPPARGTPTRARPTRAPGTRWRAPCRGSRSPAASSACRRSARRRRTSSRGRRSGGRTPRCARRRGWRRGAGSADRARPTRPSLSRNATSSSPMIGDATGGPSGSGSSWQSSTGIQKRRKYSPIGVPGAGPGQELVVARAQHRVHLRRVYRQLAGVKRGSQRGEVGGHAAAHGVVGHLPVGGGEIVGGVGGAPRGGDRARDGGVTEDPLQEELGPARAADVLGPVGQRSPLRPGRTSRRSRTGG